MIHTNSRSNAGDDGVCVMIFSRAAAYLCPPAGQDRGVCRCDDGDLEV